MLHRFLYDGTTFVLPPDPVQLAPTSLTDRLGGWGIEGRSQFPGLVRVLVGSSDCVPWSPVGSVSFPRLLPLRAAGRAREATDVRPSRDHERE